MSLSMPIPFRLLSSTPRPPWLIPLFTPGHFYPPAQPEPSPGPLQPHLASSSLVWSVRMALSAFTMQASAEMTPAFRSRFTRISMKSFLSWGGRQKGAMGKGPEHQASLYWY